MSFGVTNPSGPKLASTTIWKTSTTYTGAQTDTVIKAAPAAGLSLYITDIIMSNGATAGTMKLVEDTASAVDVIELKFLAINGNLTHHFLTPVKLTAAKDLGLTSATCTTHSVTVCGFTAP